MLLFYIVKAHCNMVPSLLSLPLSLPSPSYSLSFPKLFLNSMHMPSEEELQFGLKT